MDTCHLLFCRPGFEGDLASEIMHHMTEDQSAGYCKTLKDQGLVLSYSDEQFKPQLDSLIFARQLYNKVQHLQNLPEDDRISPIIEALNGVLDEKEYRDIVLESPDTNDGKALSRFLKKFIHPLAKTLKQEGFSQVRDRSAPYIHVCFTSYEEAYLGLNYGNNRSPHPGGIHRLKFPKDGPSRSTLKLEEAFLDLVPASERKKIEAGEGLVAVDLGAAPGGWTYQLVKRKIFTYAVDNGPMAESLMESGLVEHCREDAYKFRPRGHVDILVCDMVDKPSLVTELIKRWLENRYCDMAVFNLKLPMKKRQQEVMTCLQSLGEVGQVEIRAKQLYHDREEITVMVRLL